MQHVDIFLGWGVGTLLRRGAAYCFDICQRLVKLLSHGSDWGVFRLVSTVGGRKEIYIYEIFLS